MGGRNFAVRWLMRYRGLTLLELVIVMSIIVILLAIFVPAIYQFVKFVRHLGGN